jgi:PAS domain S-box-containing protein
MSEVKGENLLIRRYRRMFLWMGAVAMVAMVSIELINIPEGLRWHWFAIDMAISVSVVVFIFSLSYVLVRRAALATIEAEDRYRGLFENAAEGIFLVKPDGSLLVANPSFMRILGYDSRDQLLGGSGSLGTFFAEKTVYGSLLEKVNQVGSVREYEAELLSSDGGRIWVSINAQAIYDEAGKTIYHEGVAQDITARKAADQVARELQGRLEGLVEFLPFAIILLDKEGIPRYMNRASEALLGRSLKDAGPEARAGMFSQAFGLFSNGENQHYRWERLPIARAMEGESAAADDVDIHRPDGTVGVTMSAIPVPDKEGKTDYILVVLQERPSSGG